MELINHTLTVKLFDLLGLGLVGAYDVSAAILKGSLVMMFEVFVNVKPVF